MDKTHIIINPISIFNSRDRSFFIFDFKDLPSKEQINIGDLITVNQNNVKSIFKCVAIEIGTPAFKLAQKGQGVLIASKP